MKNPAGIAVLLCFCAVSVFPLSDLQNAVPAAGNIIADDALVQGFKAFQENDWPAALLFFRKAVSIPENLSAEVWYMLVTAEMYAEEYAAVINDGELFCSLFPESQYALYVNYQMGRAYHYLGENDAAIRKLGAFCSENPSHELYSSALFWISESLYESFYFDLARPLYERILSEFPDSPKYTEALYRLDLIEQRGREEKLLYLLKVTGEEYLSAKKEYERQLQQYQTEEALGLRRQLNEANEELQTAKIRMDEIQKLSDDRGSRMEEILSMNDALIKENLEMKAKIASLEQENAQMRGDLPPASAGKSDVPRDSAAGQLSGRDEMRFELEKLKKKAAELQKAVDESKRIHGGAQ
ncbi:MAG: hypothetical protein NC041_05030 [Bacteroides sp.]|nr:hypothetical protein [Prevotella sp.]MCM1407321.1 hypothetical protein [Treponema brennaborense]MCM1469811.1 hypothetical protein [Bacteroides sp.]